MARNAIKSEFWTSKMADGQKIKAVYRSEMARDAIGSEFRTSKMGADGHFVKNTKTSFVLIWNGQKCHQKWVSDIQNGRRQPFCKKDFIKIVVLIWNGKKWFLDIQNGYRRQFKKNIYKKSWASDINSLLVNIYTDMYVGNEGIYIVFALKANAHNSSLYMVVHQTYI